MCPDDHLEKKNMPLASERRNTTYYVDNILIRAKTASEAKRKCQEAKELTGEIHMPLREFFSNSKEALSDLDQNEVLPGKST